MNKSLSALMMIGSLPTFLTDIVNVSYVVHSLGWPRIGIYCKPDIFSVISTIISMLSLVPRVLATKGKLTILPRWILMLLTICAMKEELSNVFGYWYVQTHATDKFALCICKMINRMMSSLLIYIFNFILILVARLYNESLMQVLWYFSVVLVMLFLWRCVVKCACSVWMHGVFIVWNLLEDTAQLQPHYHTSRAFAWRLSLCTKTVSWVDVPICIFIYCYISLFTMKIVETQFYEIWNIGRGF